MDNAVGDIAVVRVSGLEKNAIGGDPEAQRMLGNMYYWGEYMEQSETRAIAWWSRAADKGNADAQLNISLVAAGEPVTGELNPDVGRKMWASMEEGYFEATDEFETMILPFQDAALGEDPMAEEEPSVLERLISPLGQLLTDVISAISGS